VKLSKFMTSKKEFKTLAVEVLRKTDYRDGQVMR